MPRPKSRRWIGRAPDCTWFKPAGVPLRDLSEVILELDELEAIRLAHLEGLYQDAVAERMNISRQTVGRILESAHRKVAEALTHGKALRLKGGKVKITMEEKTNPQQRTPGVGPNPQRGIGRGPSPGGPGQGQGRGMGQGAGRGQGRGRGPGKGRGR